jgi:hypothetical protein
MPRNNQARTTAPKNVTSPDENIVISRALLREILDCLALTTPLMDGKARAPERHWSAIKSVRLYRAKKLIRQALLGNSSGRGNV